MPRYDTVKLVTKSSMSAAQQLEVQKREIELESQGYQKHGKRTEKPDGFALAFTQIMRKAK